MATVFPTTIVQNRRPPSGPIGNPTDFTGQVSDISTADSWRILVLPEMPVGELWNLQLFFSARASDANVDGDGSFAVYQTVYQRLADSVQAEPYGIALVKSFGGWDALSFDVIASNDGFSPVITIQTPEDVLSVQVIATLLRNKLGAPA